MQREKVALIASHSEEREPMSKKQWLAYAQEVKNHDMSEAEALAEWKRMVDDVDGFERASKGRNGEVRIYCPTREVKTSTRAREESYEVTKQAKARKFNESGLEELREDLRQRSGFSSVSGEEWRQYGGGKAAASNSALVNAAGLTQAGGCQEPSKHQDFGGGGGRLCRRYGLYSPHAHAFPVCAWRGEAGESGTAARDSQEREELRRWNLADARRHQKFSHACRVGH